MKYGFPPEFIEQVKLSNNIVGVASRYMKLKPKGKTHWGLCPFHHEKTSSFAINENGQFYHCFGCGASGNVIGLVMHLESIDFLAAVALLAKWAGLAAPAVIGDENYAINAKKKQRILDALDTARAYYCENLYKPAAKASLEYLHKRGITDELIKLFNLGVSLDWDGVIALLKSKGFTENEIIDAGVGARSERGKLYDAMGNRITFSIFDIYGGCIGFTGRTLSGDKEIAKYKNTAQTMVFDKGAIVYGVDVLKKNKLANFVDKLIVVEGNVDVIALVGAGFVNTVACMGTALTAYHAKIFKRFSDQIYICFDGDGAGQKATMRSLDILSAENLQVRVIELPDKADPDDFIKKYGKDEFEKLIENAKPLMDFKLDFIEKTANLRDNLGRTEYLKHAIDTLKPLAGTAELELYVPKAADTAGISQNAVLKAIDKAAQENNKESPAETIGESVTRPQAVYKPPATAYTRALEFVAAAVAHKMPFAKSEILPEIHEDSYSRFLAVIAPYKTLGDAADAIEPDLLPLYHRILELFMDFEGSSLQTLEKRWEDSVKYLLTVNLKKMRDELQNKFIGASGDEQKEILQQIQELNKRMKNGNK